MRGLRRQPSKKVAPRRGWRPEGWPVRCPCRSSSSPFASAHDSTRRTVGREGTARHVWLVAGAPNPGCIHVPRSRGGSFAATQAPTHFRTAIRETVVRRRVAQLGDRRVRRRVRGEGPPSSRERRVAARPLVAKLLIQPGDQAGSPRPDGSLAREERALLSRPAAREREGSRRVRRTRRWCLTRRVRSGLPRR